MVVLGSVLTPLFSQGVASAITRYLGTETIHPSFVTGGFAVILVSLVTMILSLGLIRGRGADNADENDIATSDRQQFMQAFTDDPTQALPSEMQYALNAAFEKLRMSREGLDKEIAERTKNIEKALQDAKEIVEAIPEPLYMFAYQTPDRFSLLSANQAAAQAHNDDAKNLNGRNIEQLWPDINSRELTKAFISVMESGRTLEQDFQKYGDSGVKKAYFVRAFNISESRLGVIVSDSTSRKQDEIAFSRERGRVQMYLDTVETILVALDRDGTVTMINRAGCETLGVNAADTIGRNWFERFVPAETRGDEMLSFQRIIAGESEPAENEIHALQSGLEQERKIIWRETVLTNALGHITGMLLTGKDISKIPIDESIEEYGARLRKILDQSQIGVLLVNQDTEEIIYGNDIVATMFNVKRSDIVGGAYKDFVVSSAEMIQSHSDTDEQKRVIKRLRPKNPGTDKTFLAVIARGSIGEGKLRVENIVDITELATAEKELIQSKEEYQQLLKNANEGIFIAQNGVIPFCNPKLEELTGYTADEMANMPFSELVYEDDRDIVVENHRRRLTGEDFAHKYPFRVINKNGRILWVEIRAVVIDWMGKPGTLNFITDISERKEAEEKLQESESLYRLLTENLHDVVVKVSATGILEYVSPVIREFGGYVPEEEIGQQISKYFARKTDLIRAMALLKDVSVGEAESTFEFLYKPKEGEPFYVEVTGKAHVEEGKPVAVVCLLRNISFRKEAEKALRESEMRFRSVIESVPNIAVQGYNGEKEVIFWNKASEMLYGYTSDEALGKRLDELIIPDYHMIEEADELDLGPGENAMRHKDGSLVPVYSSHVTLKNIHGEEEMYCLDVDLTALKRAREQQKILKEKLELAERMESLGILAGGVAHDLNNMLGPMVGYSDLLLSKMEADSPYRKQIKRIGKAAQDAADVIQDLLTLARRGRYEMVPTNLNEVISDYLESPSFQQLAERRDDVELTVMLEKSVPYIMGSAPHLAKTVMNLIVNSYDAMSAGGELVVRTEVRMLQELLSGNRRIPPDAYLLLRVKDTGAGISAEDLEKIFEPYYSKKKMGTSGSGLGLAVVYGIVKDHKGYYDIFSAPGQGTEFVLYFPVTKQRVEKGPDKQADLRGKETILIIDDNAEQRQITSDLLSSLGYAVITAAGGREALGFLEGNRVDMVVVDMIMENGYDGLDTYKDILAIHPGQKAIIISGFSATERVNEMQELGAGEYVRKPFTMESLGRAVRSELDRTPAELPAR